MVAHMGTLLDQAIAKVRMLSQDRQDEAAELLMAVVEQDPDTVRLTPEQQAEVRRRLRAPSEHASHERVRAYFEKPTAYKSGGGLPVRPSKIGSRRKS